MSLEYLQLRKRDPDITTNPNSCPCFGGLEEEVDQGPAFVGSVFLLLDGEAVAGWLVG